MHHIARVHKTYTTHQLAKVPLGNVGTQGGLRHTNRGHSCKRSPLGTYKIHIPPRRYQRVRCLQIRGPTHKTTDDRAPIVVGKPYRPNLPTHVHLSKNAKANIRMMCTQTRTADRDSTEQRSGGQSCAPAHANI